jgi:MraZ protein
MFLGTHTLRLDDKARLMLPSKFRDALARGLVVTKGQERCLFVWPNEDFARITKELREAPITHKAARAYSRVLLGSAYDQTPDRQGRIMIPQALRSYAGLDRDCSVVGVGARIEIWDLNAWRAYDAESEDGFALPPGDGIAGAI